MKKVLLGLGCILLGICIGTGITIIVNKHIEKEYDIKIKFNSETKKYIQECSEKVYPKNSDGINIYSDDLKKLDYQYHQCLKTIIISKINKLAEKNDTNKLIKSLNKLQDGILSFYWNLYNREDKGILGREANDAALGFYYETLLDDIILFQQNFIWNNDDTIPMP